MPGTTPRMPRRRRRPPGRRLRRQRDRRHRARRSRPPRTSDSSGRRPRRERRGLARSAGAGCQSYGAMPVSSRAEPRASSRVVALGSRVSLEIAEMYEPGRVPVLAGAIPGHAAAVRCERHLAFACFHLASPERELLGRRPLHRRGRRRRGRPHDPLGARRRGPRRALDCRRGAWDDAGRSRRRRCWTSWPARHEPELRLANLRVPNLMNENPASPEAAQPAITQSQKSVMSPRTSA